MICSCVATRSRLNSYCDWATRTQSDVPPSVTPERASPVTAVVREPLGQCAQQLKSADEVTPYTFRHTWLKRMMGEVSPSDVSVPDLEIPLNVILDLAGHASADSLKPYTVPSAHDRQKAAERLGFGERVGENCNDWNSKFE